MGRVVIAKDVLPSMALMLDLHPGQSSGPPLTPQSLYSLLGAGEAWSVRYDGALVAIAGYAVAWPGRAVLWACLGAECGPAMPVMTLRMRKHLATMGEEFPRIEAYAETGYDKGARWLRLLGMKREGTLRKWSNGLDFDMYAMVV